MNHDQLVSILKCSAPLVMPNGPLPKNGVRRSAMKQGIHPEYQTAQIVCSCGNVIETRSTKSQLSVEICGVCHPFYTGKQKLVDTAGRVERFNRKYKPNQGS